MKRRVEKKIEKRKCAEFCKFVTKAKTMRSLLLYYLHFYFTLIADSLMNERNKLAKVFDEIGWKIFS